MYAKIFLILISFGVTASGVLMLRQQRFELCREISRVHWRTVEQRQALWLVRAEIARLAGPVQVRMALERSRSQWESIPHRLSEPAPTASSRVAFQEQSRPGPRQGFGG